MRVLIYAPDGEPFEVSEHQVGDLVLNKGWSQQKPETVEVAPAPAPVVYDEPSYVEPIVEEADEHDEDEEEEEAEPAA